MTPNEQDWKVAKKVDLECTGCDDHDTPHCWKCERIHKDIAQALADQRKKFICPGCCQSTAFCSDCRKGIRSDQREKSLEIHTDYCSECRTINDDTSWDYCDQAQAIWKGE